MPTKSPASCHSSIVSNSPVPTVRLSGVLDLLYGRIVGGQLGVGDQESTEVRFVKPSEPDGLPMGQSTRPRIQHFLERRPTPYFA
jgi:hypothetical protein